MDNLEFMVCSPMGNYTKSLDELDALDFIFLSEEDKLSVFLEFQKRFMKKY